MKILLLAFPAALLLTACSPHPGAGKWRASESNAMGITDLTLAYEGRALFTSREPAASWHCFWSGKDAENAALSCTPSTHPDREVHFRFRVEQSQRGTLYRDSRLVARFRRLEGKPEIAQ
jgi:hypothetical protein